MIFIVAYNCMKRDSQTTVKLMEINQKCNCFSRFSAKTEMKAIKNATKSEMHWGSFP